MDMLKYINRYEYRTHTSFIDEWDLGLYPNIYVFDTGEFVTWGTHKSQDYIDIGPTSCEWQKAYNYIAEIARKKGIHYVITCTVRNPKAYARLTHSVIVGHDGDLYFFKKEVK